LRNRMIYDRENERVLITPAVLSGFAVRGRGIPFRPATDDHSETEVRTLTFDTVCAGIPLSMTGTAETTIRDGICVIIHTVAGCRKGERPEYRYADCAALAVLGHLYCKTTGNSDVILRMILSSGGEDSVYEYTCSAEFLASATGALLSRATPFFTHIYNRGHEGFAQLRDLPFPYREMREAQYEFITEAFRAIKTGSRLLVSAPTGTGKTISALYPAVRAIGEGHADKIFCLCAKTTVGKAFLDAAALLANHAPHLRCFVISSKERCCPVHDRGRGTVSALCRRGCSLWESIEGKCAELRLFEAAAKCLEYTVADDEIIKAVAKNYAVCPHELSLLISEYSDIVICDYNYVFDFRIRLKRYFETEKTTVTPDFTGTFIPDEKYVLLADEVHNLPARAMDTYSAALLMKDLTDFSAIAENYAEEKALLSSLASVKEEMYALREDALRDGESREIDGVTVKSGFTHSSNLPEKLSRAVGSLRRAIGTMITRYGDTLPKIFTDIAEAVGKFSHITSLFDRNYTCFASAIGDDFYVRLICLDPSPLLDRAMNVARSVIFFSATLTPISYYADILGCDRGGVLELDSPFPKENLCPIAVDSISMKMSERYDSLDAVAEFILAATDPRPGNYMVFFPSFDYMEKAAKLLKELCPDAHIICQERSMKTSAREAFLNRFREDREDMEYVSLIGLGVLSGIFSEGIDLPGDSLIGVIICGTGMPAITSERNIMKEYFDNTREGGMEYSYIYPGFNNVLQAAGRVIRTNTDRGILVLIDSRYGEPTYFKLFPKYWRHIKYTGDPFSMEEVLRRFWNEE